MFEGNGPFYYNMLSRGMRLHMNLQHQDNLVQKFGLFLARTSLEFPTRILAPLLVKNFKIRLRMQSVDQLQESVQ